MNRTLKAPGDNAEQGQPRKRRIPMAWAVALLVLAVGIGVGAASGIVAGQRLESALQRERDNELSHLVELVRERSGKHEEDLLRSLEDLSGFDVLIHPLMQPGEGDHRLHDFLSRARLLGRVLPLGLFDFEGVLIRGVNGIGDSALLAAGEFGALVSSVVETDSVRFETVRSEQAEPSLLIAAPVRYSGSAEGAIAVLIPFGDIAAAFAPRSVTEGLAVEVGLGTEALARVGEQGLSEVSTQALPFGLQAKALMDVAAASSARRALWNEVISLVGLWVLIGGIVAWLLAQQMILAPLRALRARALALADGQHGAVGGGSLIGELDDLSRQFVAMSTVIQDRNARLEDERRRLEERVIDRTSELEAANGKLIEEVEVRQVAERRQRELAQSAAQASRAKGEFLATMSHEIRTPMTAILGYSELILEEGFDAEAEGRLRVVQRNASHLLRIINDILDLSKIEADRLEFEAVPFHVGRSVQDVEGLLRHRAEEKGLDLVVDIGESLGWVEGDPTRFRQVVTNLVGNAIKFTETGQVKLTLRASIERGSCRVDCSVADTGVGLTPQQVQRLFQPFVQGDSSHSRRFGGTGLGLVIARNLVEQMSGAIQVESVEGKGSTFHFFVILPMAPSPEEAPSSEAVPATNPGGDAEGLRVLLAEDGLDNQLLLSHILKRAGVDVAMASNGREALDLVDREGVHSFDVILMDMQMPVMDGYSAARALRVEGLETPIVALTAHAMPEQRQECLDAGCDAFVSKPVSKAALLRAIAVLGRQGRSAASQLD